MYSKMLKVRLSIGRWHDLEDQGCCSDAHDREEECHDGSECQARLGHADKLQGDWRSRDGS
jgi:hypothetical protein